MVRGLDSFRGVHQGEAILVCGCGESLNELAAPGGLVTVGVNDVGRRLQPDYLVVVNPRRQFTGDRFRYVETSKAKVLFTHLDLGVAHPNVVRFRLGRHGGTDFDDPNVLHYTQNSPYVAVCLAVHMGAERIGLVGVDFTDHHFFGPTGRHALAGSIERINREYAALSKACAARGIELVNLSAQSRLTVLPKLPLAVFVGPATARPPRATRGLSIVSYATTPIAGVPAILARCINARTAHGARCVWARNGYGNGVVFDGDIEWLGAPAAAERALETADLVIVHNGKVDARHRALLAGKPVVTMAHNYLWNVDQGLVERGFPGAVVGQYQAALPEFREWAVVPNPLPFWEERYRPRSKGPEVTICYTPSGKHERYSPGHRLYWHAKGYVTTMAVLERLARRWPLRLEVIRERQVAHAEALAMKRRAHIVIDECATGSYHRNSLEGLAAGCVVVNALGSDPAILDAFNRCVEEGAEVPFLRAELDTLEAVLQSLVQRGTAALVEGGAVSRAWLETHWEFGWQWQRFWQPLVDRALERAQRGPSRSRAVATAAVPQRKDPVDAPSTVRPPAAPKDEPDDYTTGVSVVIPHGGRARLPHLRTTVAMLAQSREVEDIIVVDMGTEPVAEDIARRWGASYVFTAHAGPFERARALNIGSALAITDLVLWLDNDLTVPPGFVVHAAAELRAHHIDYLIPYTTIRYLSESDTALVMSGARGLAECQPARILKSGRDVSGGGGLVRKRFIDRFGGFCEDFKGWGGEDNAWSYKVHLLGRRSVTGRGDQHLHHLFHPNSGAFAGHPQNVENPFYAQNVALLREIGGLRGRNAFLRRFPPPEFGSCPWTLDRRIVVLVDPDGPDPARRAAESFVRGMHRLFGITSESAGAIEDLGGPDNAGGWNVLVAFGSAATDAVLRTPEWRNHAHRVLVVLAAEAEPTDIDAPAWERVAGVVTDAPRLAAALRISSDRVWPLPAHAWTDESELRLATTIAQPISLILNQNVSLLGNGRGVAAAKPECDDRRPPVWLYWEGERPAWIQACQRTILKHAPGARLLTPETFDALWDSDRDIDLGRLGPAQRADFIRAFLLARHGGLWIDSDCIAMRSLQPLLDALKDYDFLAHRDRQGYYPNGLIGARLGSAIAAAFYRRVCELLRSGRPLGWIALGGQPLTELLRTTRVRWHEVPCERIQPVCWSEPGAFFDTASDEVHAAKLDPDAFCYMLSNTEIGKYRKRNRGCDLLGDGTFFRFLVSRSLDESSGPGEAAPSTEHPAESAVDVAFVLDVLKALAPKAVLEIAPRPGRIAALVRGFHVHPDDVQVTGVATDAGGARPGCEGLFTAVHAGRVGDVSAVRRQRWCLAVIDAAGTQASATTVNAVLDVALATADYVLVLAVIDARVGGAHDPVARATPLDDLLARTPIRSRVTPLNGTLRTGGFLFSQDDPRALGRAPVRRTFTQIYQSNQEVGDESVSGPGSCLAQTVELRRRLPLILEDIGARSMLDAPCGDVFWMSQVRLGIDRYIGVDVVPDLIAVNRRRHGAPDRTFLCLDLIRDALPEVDVIFCRDCLVHYPFEAIVAALRNFRRSGSCYLLMTTFTNPRNNTDIETGDWRPLNFERPPLGLPPPLRIINECCTEAGGQYGDKSMGLWHLPALTMLQT